LPKKRNLSTDPDIAFRQLDDEEQYKYLLLDSPMAEELFCKHYLDLELAPYQVFSMKLIRGRFHNEEEVYRFIDEYKMDWMFDNGWIRHGNSDGISPFYWEKPNVLILWPAGFGKTTIVSTRAVPVMEICDNPNSRSQYIGKNETEGFSFSTSIRRELTNPRLEADFGIFKPTDKAVPWSNQAFSVQQREWRDVRENFEFYGTNSHAELGKRSDRVLIDDVETPDTARTPDMRDKLLEWMRIGPFTSARPIWPRDGLGNVRIPKGIQWSRTARYWSTAIVGTIFHPEALYAMVMRDPTFTCVKFDCYKDKKCTVGLSQRPDGTDTMLSIKDLERERRSIGILAFNKRYRNIAYNEEEMAFREAWVRGLEEEISGQRINHVGCLDENRSFGNREPSWQLFAGFDPASGSRSRWSAYAAYVILGIDPDDESRRVYLVDYLKLQENFDRMLDHLLEGNSQYGIEGFYKLYQYQNATVEKNAFGKWIIDNDRMKPFVEKNLIVPHYTGTNKVDPEAGVFAMGNMIQDGRFRIPYKESSDKDKAENFIGELLMYPKGTCDLVMAMWLATRNMGLDKHNWRSYATKGAKVKWYKNPGVA
jgi:hypothetical protein